MNISVTYKDDILNINYSDSGSGDILLILHGWGANIDVYKSITDIMSCHMRVVSLDMPGFGKSDEPSFPYSVEDYKNFVCAFLKKLDIKHFSVLGHSHGGRVAMSLAADKDNQFAIDKMVLLDSAGIVPKKTFSQKARIRFFKIAKVFFKLPVISCIYPDAIENLRRKSGSADYNSATPVMRDSLVKCVNTDLRQIMPLISCPTLMIWGDKDTATPVSDAKIMENLIKDSGIALLNGGHYSFLDSPYVFKNVMYSFFGIK